MENGKILSTSNKILAIELQNKEVIPSIETQVVTADEGYIGLDKVIVKPIEFAPPEKAYFFPTKFDENGYVIEAESRGIVGNLPANFLGVGTTSTSSSDDKYKNMFYDKLKVFILNEGVTGAYGYQSNYGSFMNMTALTDIYIPSTFYTNGGTYDYNQYGFIGCKNLCNIHFVSFLKVFSTKYGPYGYNLMSAGQSSPINVYVNDELVSGDVVIPNGALLSNYALYKVGNITSLDFSNFGGYNASTLSRFTCSYMPDLLEVKNLSGTTGQYMFYNCKSLKKVDTKNVTAIEYTCFQGCTSLEKLSLDNVNSINNYAFVGCTNLLLFDFRNSTRVPTLSNTGAFESTSSTKKIVVPDSLYDTWITATNWSSSSYNIVSSIIKASDYEASL